MPYHLADASPSSHHFLDGPYKRIPTEIGCAAVASFLVSPIVSIIDKAIVQEVTGVKSLMASMGKASRQMFLQPDVFFKGLSFRLTFAVYFGTYAVANVSEAFLDFAKENHEERRKYIKVSCASAANIGLLAWRDSVFAREFSASKNDPSIPKRVTTPVRTVGLFAARDFVTMTATFYVAPKVSNLMVEEYGWDRHKSEVVSSLTFPVIAQFLTAPFHIHALDYYNRPIATFGERIHHIRVEFGKVCLARGLRILPAFGIGSFSNNKLRELAIRQEPYETNNIQLTTSMTEKIAEFRESFGSNDATTKCDRAN